MIQFANALIAAHQSGTRFTPTQIPTTAAQAYDIQARVVSALGPVSGFKTARKPDAPLIMAPILAQRVWPSGAHVKMGETIGIELEIGWKIIAPLPAPTAQDFHASLLRCVLPVPVIELVDTRLSGPLADDPIAKLADLQLNHGLIVGAPLMDWNGTDFGDINAKIQTATRVLCDGPTQVPGGSALATLSALAMDIGEHCGGLQPGQVVITGSVYPLTYTSETGLVQGKIDWLGEVSVTLT